MVPRRPGELSEHGDGPTSGSRDDESESASEASDLLDEEVDMQDGVEPEYHTEESQEETDERENDSEHELLDNTAPLLPKELLKPLPSPAFSFQHAVLIPREQMTREQKVAQRNRSRKSKKRVWDRLKRDSEGTGVLEAGKVAQWKRGIIARKDRVASGRVAKKAKVKQQVSGRQQLLEDRKRAVEQSKCQLLRPPKKGRKSGQRTSAG